MRQRRYVLMITAPILATSVLLLVVGGAAAWYVHGLNREVSELLARNLQCALASQQLVRTFGNARQEMLRFLDTGDQSNLRAVVTIERVAERNLHDAEQAATTDELRNLIGRTRLEHQHFYAEFEIVTQDMTPAERLQRVRELTESMNDKLLVPAEELLVYTQQATVQHSNRNLSLANEIGLGLLALGACGAVAGLLAGYAIARGVAARLEQSEHEAMRAEQLATVGQLAAGLAHELRNPLTAMRLLVESGREAGGGGRLEGHDLEVLDEESNRLEKLVESFLDFARPPKLEKAKLDARALVNQTMHVVAAPARQRGATIDWPQPGEPVTIEADPVQMRQVVLNLLLNALDAAGENGRVTVEVDRADHDEDSVHAGSAPHVDIRISDNGPGVPDDMKEKIFEPFVSSKEVGMGLGLAVSQRIVEAHGGQITVTDNPGGGARFTISLPTAENDE